jgi:predicted PurR-regulated permease PerM
MNRPGEHIGRRQADTAPSGVTLVRGTGSMRTPRVLAEAATTGLYMAEQNTLAGRGAEIGIRIGVLVLLVAWCFVILQPFIGIIGWSVVMAVALHPTFDRVRTLLGGRTKSAALLMTIVFLLVFIVPAAVLSETLVTGVRVLAKDLQNGTLAIPLPSASVQTWPMIGERLAEVWTLAATNLDAAILQFRDEFAAMGRWLLGQAAKTGLGLVQFFVAVLLSGVLLATAKSSSEMSRRIARQIVGPHGERFARLAVATTRSVARGVLGVALIQATLAGLGFLVVGIPGAGLWAIIALMLCIVQVGPALVLIPAVIYIFSTATTATAVLFAVWCAFVTLIDNVLKPMLLGRGVDVPMFIVVVGAIGGLLTMGVIGLFVGAIVLVLGYSALVAWVSDPDAPPQV